MNYLLGFIFLAALVKCEPPVSRGYQAGGFGAQNGYLPPPRTGYSPPSNNYLPPTSGSGYHGSDNSAGNYGNHGNHQGHGQSHENEVPKSYEFGYSVKDANSGNDYDRRESSDGNVVRGEYRVQLPDGRMQIVTYHADWQTGFHADVRYEGEARYPEPTNRGQGGYNYNTPDYSGSLSGFPGSSSSSGYQPPSTAYGPPGYH